MPRTRNIYVLDPTDGGGIIQRSKSTDSVLQSSKHPEDTSCVNPVLSVSCDTIDNYDGTDCPNQKSTSQYQNCTNGLAVKTPKRYRTTKTPNGCCTENCVSSGSPCHANGTYYRENYLGTRGRYECNGQAVVYNRKRRRKQRLWCAGGTVLMVIVLVYLLAILLPLILSDWWKSISDTTSTTTDIITTTQTPVSYSQDTQKVTSRVFLAQFTVDHVTSSVQSATRTSVTSLIEEVLRKGKLAKIYKSCNVTSVTRRTYRYWHPHQFSTNLKIRCAKCGFRNGNTVADVHLVFNEETDSQTVEDNLRTGLSKVKWSDGKKISVKAWPYGGVPAGGISPTPGESQGPRETVTDRPLSYSTLEIKGCASDQFRCDDGQCIYLHQRCDLKPHCNDRSDETNCTGECSRGRRRCPEGKCIMAEWVCDGEEDCFNGTDEKNCGDCSSWEFQCADYTCVPQHEKCNGRPACNDSSDEYHCVRLASDSDLVEVYHAGEWLPVCAHDVTAQHARLFCRSLGRGSLEKFISLAQPDPVQEVLHFVPSQTQFVHAALSKRSYCPGSRLLAISCAQLECGQPKKAILRPYIVNGLDAPPGKWPWQISLRKMRAPLCGGVVLGPRHVLTAAHCIEKLPDSPHLYDVVLGTTKSKTQDNSALVVGVEKMWMNPRFKNFSGGDDIAVIMLKQKIQFNDMIQPICLPRGPDEKMPVTARCYVTGWGYLDYHAKNNPNDLQEAKMQLWDTERCNSTEFYNGSLPWSTMCAGYSSGYISICKGDSGGPLMCQDEHDRWRLMGITSFMNRGCDVPLKPSVFTSVLKELDFIRNATSCRFTCDNGKCLYDKSLICNRHNDCGDDSDETRLCVASVNCTFEDKFLCGYVFENRYSKLRWERRKGDTDTAYTGPNKDYNSADSEGYYLYLEATRGSRDDFATLYTPAVISSNTTCLQFHYHMYGEGVGRLDVFYFNGSHKWYLWTARGDQGNTWRRGQASLRPSADTPRPYKFQIWFQAYHSGSVYGYIALDDIRLLPHECPEFVCAPGQYKCRSQNQCIDVIQECDVTKHCSDGSDEDHCNWSMSCDFQQPTLCGYVNYQPNDKGYLWRHYSGKTRTEGRGPSKDHTYRNETGYYVSVDGLFGKVNSSVSLLSPPYKFRTMWCLRFRYHMDGDKYQLSKLHIRLRYSTGFYRMDVLHRRTGDRWRLFERTFHPDKHALQIAFMAVRASSEKSVVALDDIRVTEGACAVFSCEVGEFTCRHSKECIPGDKLCDGFNDCFYNEDETDCPDLGLDCNFDSVSRHSCLYSPDLTARARFHFTNYYTNSSYTGPTSDHTTPEGEGFYAYLEATGPLHEQDSARLVSPPTNFSQPYCLRFHYHMFGTGVGMLKVYVKRDGVDLPDHWQIRGNQWNFWRYAQLTIPSGDNQQVVLEAIRGRSYRSDIAIDDIIVREGACPKYECPVDQYTCGNHKCISRHLVCDSYNDCSDYSDEIHCTCTSSEFRCDMGMCIPLSQHCDGQTQCPDLSDETGCPTCSHTDFACRDFSCVPKSARCDDVTSCPDGSDEHGCFRIDADSNVLSVFSKHSYHPVCTDGWSHLHDDIICQKLGYHSAESSGRATFVHGTYATLARPITAAHSVTAFTVGPFCPNDRVVTLFCLPKECGQPYGSPPSSSTGDHQLGVWPWLAGVLSHGGRYACAAALIDREVLVTAARCFPQSEIIPSSYSVFLGSSRHALSSSDPRQLVMGVRSVIRHKHFDGRHTNDIALLVLERPVNYTDHVRPVCVPEQSWSLSPASVCYMSGWGRSDDTNDRPKTLQESKMRLYSVSKCNSSVYWDGSIPANTICAGYDPVHTSICTSEPGGPLVCLNEHGHWTLSGITSLTAGRGCTEHAKPNAYTQVSKFAQWIRDALPCEFRCSEDHCLVSLDLVCDGVRDCQDGRDEAMGVCALHVTDAPPITTEAASIASSCTLEDGLFDCGNGTCVDRQLYCDGLPHCPRGEDEPENCRCSEDQFRCENGQCIHAQGLCNSLAECWDLSDETKCNCSEGEFRCASGVCKPLHQRCDGINQCLDFSDEINCLCTGLDKFHCDNGVCLSQKKICDSYDDCGDLSDEKECACDPSWQFACDGGMCVQKQWQCDGYNDCDDGSDERNCDSCSRGEFSCRDYSCQLDSARCNGVLDCSDGSDEDKCFEFRTMTEDGTAVVYGHHGDRWLPVCADDWASEYSDRVCQHLGFGSATRTSLVTSPGRGHVISASLNASILLQGNLRPRMCESGQAVSISCQSKDCGQPSPRLSFEEASIVGGRLAQEGEWPWMGGVYYLDKFICGATLINDDWVLTGAHCFHNKRINLLPHNVKVVLGTTSSRQSGAHAQAVRASRIELHPEFRQSPLPVNDVALVRLKHPVQRTDYVRPVCLHGHAGMFGLTSHCFVSGWGITQVATRTSTDRLRVAKMRLWPGDRCDETIGPAYNGSSMICARYDTGSITACSGDSGGPLQCLDANGKWTLTGVLSFGTDCTTINRQGETKPDIYANATFYLPWIRETLDSYDLPTT